MPQISPGFPLAAAVVAASVAFVPMAAASPSSSAGAPPPPKAAAQVPVLAEKLAPPAPVATARAVPAQTQTTVPAQTQTTVPAQTQTTVPAQTQTTVPAPTRTTVPAPAEAIVPAPTETVVPAQPKTDIPAQTPPAVPAPTVSAPPPPVFVVPLWAAGLLVALGGLLGGIGGFLALVRNGRAERAARRRSAATVLAAELAARRRAFERVPAPPNAEAGVSFVAAVSALESLSMGFTAAGDGLTLLPPALVSQAVEHYAEVRRIATFVKGQSLAAAARMLQGNRLGGTPSPDAATLRAAYIDLAGAFRGVEKLVEALERYQ